jgi:hypothetical protein
VEHIDATANSAKKLTEKNVAKTFINKFALSFE